MMKIERTSAPECLHQNYKQWGHEYATKSRNNSTYRFQWKKCKGKAVDVLIKPELVNITKNHCSYCDSYPLGTAAQQTIYHFRPKKQFPFLAYVWQNLFLVCNACQNSKQDFYDKKLLKPDTISYEFERYFVINYKTGCIEVNPGTNIKNQERARLTIEVFGLNKFARPHSRLREYQKYQDLCQKGYCIDDFSYRFFM